MRSPRSPNVHIDVHEEHHDPNDGVDLTGYYEEPLEATTVPISSGSEEKDGKKKKKRSKKSKSSLPPMPTGSIYGQLNQMNQKGGTQIFGSEARTQQEVMKVSTMFDALKHATNPSEDDHFFAPPKPKSPEKKPKSPVVPLAQPMNAQAPPKMPSSQKVEITSEDDEDDVVLGAQYTSAAFLQAADNSLIASIQKKNETKRQTKEWRTQAILQDQLKRGRMSVIGAQNANAYLNQDPYAEPHGAGQRESWRYSSHSEDTYANHDHYDEQDHGPKRRSRSPGRYTEEYTVDGETLDDGEYYDHEGGEYEGEYYGEYDDAEYEGEYDDEYGEYDEQGEYDDYEDEYGEYEEEDIAKEKSPKAKEKSSKKSKKSDKKDKSKSQQKSPLPKKKSNENKAGSRFAKLFTEVPYNPTVRQFFVTLIVTASVVLAVVALVTPYWFQFTFEISTDDGLLVVERVQMGLWEGQRWFGGTSGKFSIPMSFTEKDMSDFTFPYNKQNFTEFVEQMKNATEANTSYNPFQYLFGTKQAEQYLTTRWLMFFAVIFGVLGFAGQLSAFFSKEGLFTGVPMGMLGVIPSWTIVVAGLAPMVALLVTSMALMVNIKFGLPEDAKEKGAVALYETLYISYMYSFWCCVSAWALGFFRLIMLLGLRKVSP